MTSTAEQNKALEKLFDNQKLVVGQLQELLEDVKPQTEPVKLVEEGVVNLKQLIVANQHSLPNASSKNERLTLLANACANHLAMVDSANAVSRYPEAKHVLSEMRESLESLTNLHDDVSAKMGIGTIGTNPVAEDERKGYHPGHALLPCAVMGLFGGPVGFLAGLGFGVAGEAVLYGADRAFPERGSLKPKNQEQFLGSILANPAYAIEDEKGEETSRVCLTKSYLAEALESKYPTPPTLRRKLEARFGHVFGDKKVAGPQV